MMTARRPPRLVIICLILAMMVTSCGHKSVSSAPTNITEAPTAASTPGSRPLTAHHDGVEIAYQRIGTIGDQLLLTWASAPTCATGHGDFCNVLVRNGVQVARFDNRDSGATTHLDWVGTPDRRRCHGIPTPRPTAWRLLQGVEI
jgi:hypothetical protein